MRFLPLLLVGWALFLVGCRARLPVETPKVTDHVKAARDAAIESYPWPETVTGEERLRIEEALRVIFDVGGREAREAEAFVVGLDRDADATAFRAAGRLVSEMKTVTDSYDMNEYEGKSRIMVLDRMLRRIDGVQERLFGEETGLDIDDSAARALRLVRQWNWWYREGRFQQRYAPWDPRVDLVDDGEEEEGN